MESSFKADELPSEIQLTFPDDESLRCPHYIQEKGGPCNKLLCKGRASIEPQEFYCKSCKNRTVFVRIGDQTTWKPV